MLPVVASPTRIHQTEKQKHSAHWTEHKAGCVDSVCFGENCDATVQIGMLAYSTELLQSHLKNVYLLAGRVGEKLYLPEFFILRKIVVAKENQILVTAA